jgi:hypothetical protein
MKMKLLLLLSIVCSTFFAANATQITAQDAHNVAINFFKIATSSQTTLTANLVYTRTETDSTVSLYVYNMSPVKGFVIVSASDNDDPIIGYSTESAFASDFSKSGLNEWLGRWGQEIDHVEKYNIIAEPNARALWASYRQGISPYNQRSSGVGPLCHTSWDQSNTSATPVLYNGDCPSSGGTNAVTGCVATAMAQIMKYWNYPTRGVGIASYNDNTSNGFSYNYGIQTFNFNTTPFNWANMPDSLTASTTSAQDSAIALISYACGVSVHMDYGINGSGAWVFTDQSTDSASAQQAYPLYFKYNPNTLQAFNFDSFTTTAWITVIENEHNQGRPVQYQGWGAGGGHTWVCDGYNSSNMLHMNWGWGGLDNGWYSCTNLNTSVDDFTTTLGALIGIEPGIIAQASPSVICIGDTSVLSVSGGPAISTYSWTPATGLSCTTCASPKASPAVTTTYTVTVDSAGSSLTGSVTVYVTTPHVLSYTLSDSGLCNGSSATASFFGESGLSIQPSASVAWQNSSTATLTPDSSTLYMVTASSVCGTNDTAFIPVQVTQHTPVSFNLSSSTICYGSTTYLTCAGLNNITVSPNYYYYYGNDSNTLVFDPYSTTSYVVSGTSSCGSIYTDTFTIYVSNYSGSIDYTLSQSTICQGDSSILTIINATNVQITPAGSVIPLGNNIYKLLPDSNTTFFVTAYDAYCGGTVSAQVPVNVVPTASLSYSLTSNVTCAGNYDYLYLYGINGTIQSSPYLYFYYETTNEYYAELYPDTTTTYTIWAPTICGTVDTSRVTVFVHPQPSYTLQRNSICQGDSTLLTLVGLTGVSISPNTGFRMTDSIHYELSPSVTTTYQVSGTNCSGYLSSYTITVTVVQPGTVNYTLTDSVICSSYYNDELNLYGIINPQITPYNYVYMLDSTDYYSYLSPTVTTQYTVSGQSVCGGQVSATFTIHILPAPSYTLSNTDLCPGTSATLKTTGINYPSITPSNTANWLNDSVAILNPTTTTDYYLTGYDCNGNFVEYYVYVTVRPNSLFTFSIDSEICSGGDAYLSVSGGSDITISPYVANLYYTDSFDAYAYLYPTTTTRYMLTALSACTNTRDTDYFTVYVLSGSGSYTLSRPTVCGTDSTILNIIGLYNVYISPTLNTTYINTNSYYLYPTVTTTYTITGYANCTGAYSDQQFTLTVGGPLIATEALDSVICPYDSTIICASAGFVNYTWNTGQTGLCIEATLPGYYYVVGTDVYNCTSQSTPLHISVLSGTALQITERNDTLFAPVANTYQWLLNGNPIAGATQSFFVVGEEGIYAVQLTANGCTETSNNFSTGITNIGQNNAFEVYPNPSTGKWTIESDQPKPGGVCQIYDSEGRLVYTQNIMAEKFDIEPDLSAGVYLLKILTQDQLQYQIKLVKL